MNITYYALSVFSVIIISAVADIMLPDGKIRKTAKAVFSLMISLTLLSPAIKLISGDAGVPSITAQVFEADEDLICHAFDIAKRCYENEIFTLLKDSGYETINSVECAVDFENRKLEKVMIIYDKSGINDEDEHTYISGMKNVVCNVYNLSGEAVTVSGG